MSEGVDAAIFYVSVAALVGGIMRALRASIERKVRDRAGIVVAVCGAFGLVVAVIAFLIGPKAVLPF